MTSTPPSRVPYFRSSVAALSLANLCLLEVWRQLFSKPEEQFYFARSHGLIDFVGALIALLCLAVFFFALLVAGHVLRPRLAWQLLVAAFTLVPLNVLRLNSSLSWAHIKDTMSLPIVALILLGMVLALPTVWRKRESLFPGLVTALLAFSPFVFITVSRTVAGAWGSQSKTPADSLNPASNLPATAGSRSESPSVVVLLFDELDNRFISPSTRPDGLDLPELDRLRKESVVFENAVRAGAETLTAVPSLVLGAVVDKAEPRGASELRLVQGERVSRWGDPPDLFAVAAGSGIEVHIVGWYQPYCRIFPMTSSCTWQPHSEYFVGQGQTLSETVAGYLHSLSPFNRSRLAAQTYEHILRDAQQRVRSARGLVWIHMPIPHLPVVYDRRTRSVTAWGGNGLAGYLDNLALVDETVGRVRREMGDAWDRSAVVLVSDHNWRLSAAYDGKDNDRVPLYIKPPRSSQHRLITAEVSARFLPYAILAMLRSDGIDAPALQALALAGPSGPLRW